MRPSVAVLLVGMTLSVPVAAQTVDEVVARHVEARGGYEKLKAIQTIKLTRTVATAFSNIRVIVYKKRPQSFRAEQGPMQPGAPLTPRGVNAEGAWDMAGGKAVLRAPAAATATREIDADFDGLLVDWKPKGHTVTLEGKERLSSGEAYRLKVKTASGVERMVYLDATTFLERRQTGVLSLPDGRRFDVVIDFDNYREVAGVQFPHDITEERTGTEPVQSLVTYTEKIEVNVPMEDALFTPPKG